MSRSKQTTQSKRQSGKFDVQLKVQRVEVRPRQIRLKVHRVEVTPTNVVFKKGGSK